MKIVHRKRALHQKKLLRFTDNGAKIAPSSGTVTATWCLRVAALARFFRGKLDNAAIGNAQN
jgi:hypothetical protein